MPRLRNNIECAAQALRTHIPKIEKSECDLFYPNNGLDQISLFNELLATIKAIPAPHGRSLVRPQYIDFKT